LCQHAQMHACTYSCRDGQTVQKHSATTAHPMGRCRQKISEQMDHTMQDGRVVGEERLVLDTNEVVIVTSLPDTSSHERDVIPAPPVVTS